MEWEDYWLKGKENLEMALLAHQSKKYNVCASRAYFAVFLASVAALIQLTSFRAKNNDWRHDAVQAELNRQLIVRRRVLPSDLARIPLDLMALRHLADYKPPSVSAGEAKKACDRANKFLSAIETALGKTL